MPLLVPESPAPRSSGAGREIGDGPLSRAFSAIYTLLVVELLLLAGTAPGLALLTVLDRDPSNLPLAALAAVPVGPALSAALVTLQRPRHLVDLHPATHFCQAYRRNAGAVLRLWVPLLALLTVIGVNLTHLDAAGVPAAWAVMLALIAVAALLGGLNAVVISSFFTFRTQDTARLAWYFLLRTPGVTLGTASLLIVAGAVTAQWSEAVLALLASLLVLLLSRTFQPLIALVHKDFTQ
jgi:hypothetical protein